MDGCQTDLDEEAEEKKGAEDTKDDEGAPEVSVLPLERSMRILPHDQDTGGFFIAVFQKVAPYKGTSTMLLFRLFGVLLLATIYTICLTRKAFWGFEWLTINPYLLFALFSPLFSPSVEGSCPFFCQMR